MSKAKKQTKKVSVPPKATIPLLVAKKPAKKAAVDTSKNPRERLKHAADSFKK